MSAMAGEKSGTYDKAFAIDCPGRNLYLQTTSTDMIHITLPKLSFRFTNLTENQIDRLEEIGLEDRNIKGKGQVWVGTLTSTQAMEVLEFGVVDNYAAMGGTVSIKGIRAINDILKLITLSAQSLSLVNNSQEQPVKVIEYHTAFTSVALRKYSCSTMSEMTTKVEKEKGVSTGTKPSDTVILCKEPLPRIWGSMNELTNILSNGIFCPFEPNFSQTDRRAIHLLLSDFSCLCSESETFGIFDESFVEIWTKELCLTMEGEFIAHMIATLHLARKIGARICFLVTGNLYEGSILHGAKEFSFKLVGGTTYSSLKGTELIADIEGYAFHSTTLVSLLEAVGVGGDVIPSQIKTMRQLRTIVMGKQGHALTPDIEATVAKKLVFLNFREKPEAVNPSSLGKFFSYIHPSAPTVIPESVYLDRRAFFSKDPMMLALSMFGMYAPSPIISGQTLLLAVASNSSKKPSNEPPSIQFCLKELSISARDWEGFIRGGAIVQPGTKIRRGRRFAGTDKAEIWGRMTTLAAAGASAKRNENIAKRSDMVAEKRSREDERDEAVSDRKAKLTRGVDFSMFEPVMEE
jgi:hypothetical protein